MSGSGHPAETDSILTRVLFPDEGVAIFHAGFSAAPNKVFEHAKADVFAVEKEGVRRVDHASD